MRRVWLSRLVVLAASVALPAAQSSAPPQQVALGTISGTVTRAGTTVGLAGVVVSVEVPAQRTNAARPISVTTDASGRFTLTAPEGYVIVSAERDGYYEPMVMYGAVGSVVTQSVVVSAQQPAVVHLELMPGGTISGRVVDPAGKPAPHLRVYSLGRFYSSSGVPVLSWTGGTQTDNQGAYRLSGLGPGERYVLAVRLADDASAGTQVVSTYYPGAIDVAAATTVDVRFGEEVNGTNIQLRSAATYSISGRIASTAPPLSNPARQSAQITLVPHDAVLIPQVTESATQLANADGSFLLQHVPNGRYDVLARVPAAQGWGLERPATRTSDKWVFGRRTVEVHGRNVMDVSIPVHQGQDVGGRVLVDDKPDATALLQIHLVPDDVLSEYAPFVEPVARFSPTIDPSGSFVFPLMPAGRYRLGYGSFRAYVADVLMNGVSVYDNGLTIGTDPIGSLEIIAKTDAGTVEGIVTDVDSKPVRGAGVVLVPDNHRSNPGRYGMATSSVATSSEAGRFWLRRLAPGTYKLFAWDQVSPGQWHDAEFLSRYESLGLPVTVSAGGKSTVNLRVIRTAK